ncbi:hypothetical protein B4135_2594 [Caldibacillus debilis]|nr:hypothetical protein B4135_2594 [Caldibacillus debilis]
MIKNSKRDYDEDKKGGMEMGEAIFLILALILGITVLFNLGPIIVLAITLSLAYVAFRQYKKAGTTGKKMLWLILCGVFLIASVTNAPAVVGLAAAAILYLLYKNRKEKKDSAGINGNGDDPFVHFEKEWRELSRSYRPNEF